MPLALQSNLHPGDTIAALASAPGSAQRGILRVSGGNVVPLLTSLFASPPAGWPPASRLPRMHAGSLRVKGLSRPLPVEVSLWPGRRSYTGEPLAEIHTIGSPPILEAILSDLYAAGARPAQPGEFTLRAFFAGRVDLVQAEAVLGVIDAQDQHELQSALAQLAGGISTEIGRLRGDLLDLLADLEAGLDFSEEDIQFIAHGALVSRLTSHLATVEQMLSQSAERMRSSVQPRVVLAGPPNAGKSTLFNALVERDAAIVSDIRGTTRDYLSADVTWNGLLLSLVDTAGEETETGGIGAEAQHRREEQLDRADLILWCVPADDTPRPMVADTTPPCHEGEFQDKPGVRVVTKCDLLTSPAPTEFIVSAKTGAGLLELKDGIVARLTQPSGHARQFIGTTAARCRDSLAGARDALARALSIAEHESDQELLAIETREALDELGKIVGAVYTDDILDRIFAKFCIGK